MSYSFSVRGATKEEVAMKVAIELDKVVEAQPIHDADYAKAKATVKAFLDIVPVDTSKDIYASVNGSVGWREDKTITSASIDVSISLVAKDQKV